MYTLTQTSSCGIFEEEKDRYKEEFDEREEGVGDVILSIGDERTAVHRKVLSAKSDYFESMFCGNFVESKATSIDLSDTCDDFESLSAVLDYMYLGTITLTEENIVSVVGIASVFLLGDLLNACSEFLMANIAPCTCIPIFDLAEKYSLVKVRDGCVEVFKAWFPFYLCHTKKALDMSPDCLKALVKENVFALISDDVLQTFLEEWQQRLKNISSRAIKLPKEVKNLIKSKCKGLSPQADGESANDDKMEEVLIGLRFPLGTGRRCSYGLNKNCTEILAFTPETKSWKLILRHEFSHLVEPQEVEELIGVTEEKAFYLFRPEGLDFEYMNKRFIGSVDIESKEEHLIKLPNGVKKYPVPNYFIWGTKLCGFFSADGVVWSVYQNEHDTQCTGACTGDCWDHIGKMPKKTPKVGCDVFVTKEYEDKVYVGGQHQGDDFYFKFFCISRNKVGKKCKIVELDSPGGFEDFKFEFEIQVYQFSYISVDRETSSVKFTLKFETPENPIDLADELEPYHREFSYTYDVANQKWKGKRYHKVVYPKDVSLPLQVTRRILDNEDSKVIKCDFDLDATLHCYYARSTSPYNTCIWKYRSESKDWLLLTHSPGPIDAFYSMETSEIRRGFARNLPNARFPDFSEQIGQSAVTNMSVAEPSPDFEMEFGAQLLNHMNHKYCWGKFWEGKNPFDSEVKEDSSEGSSGESSEESSQGSSEESSQGSSEESSQGSSEESSQGSFAENSEGSSEEGSEESSQGSSA